MRLRGLEVAEVMATTKYDGFTADERSAMKDRAKELKAAKGDPGSEVLAKLAEMSAADREVGEKLHALIRAAAPELTPKLWYGMPAYARNGKLVCHFQPAGKFKTRYATLGFSDQAALDDGACWPVSYAIAEVTAEVEARIAALLKQALG